jgi:mono/diheme cytochrome c family protein
MIEMAKKKVLPPQQQQIANVLTAMFGTPDEPYVLPQTGLDLDMLKLVSGPVHRDAIAGPRGLYREHCVHCHGTTGDGDGPTAAFLNPYPRDYRRGWYKFKSSKRDERPSTDDLMRTLYDGLQGSAMPSFKLLPEVDRRALVEYVKYLSMRGEMELAVLQYLGEADKPNLDDPKNLLPLLMPIVERWQNQIPIAVADRPEDMKFDKISDPIERRKAEDESIAIGRQIFTHETPGEFKWAFNDGSKNPPPKTIQYIGAACIKCHGPTALGDGQTTDFDDWTKQVWSKEAWSQPADATPSQVMPLGALPKRTITPRNLRLGVYRGGRRPLDIYYRIHEGIKGAPMPATELLTQAEKDSLKAVRADAEKKAKANPDLQLTGDESDEEALAKQRKRAEFIAKIVDPAIEKIQSRRIWYLVDYVRSLPYEPGGELGADAQMSNMESSMELHAR